MPVMPVTNGASETVAGFAKRQLNFSPKCSKYLHKARVMVWTFLYNSLFSFLVIKKEEFEEKRGAGVGGKVVEWGRKYESNEVN